MSTQLDTADRISNPFATAPIVSAPSSASAQALAIREATHIQTAMVLAAQFPRDQARSTDKILIACTRLTLAEEATYLYSRGGTEITGPTIRLAEEIRRNWGNMLSGWEELGRTDGRSEIRTYCWDLESRTCEERKFMVRHWRDTRQGGYALTDERDIYETNANQAARRLRACILASIPGDVIAAAVDQCKLTMTTKVEITPERIAGMLEKFAAHQVTQEMIEKRIQRHLDSITPAGFLQLGRIYIALRDGLGKVSDYFQVSPAEPTPETVKPSSSSSDAVKQRLRERQQAQDASKGGKKDTGKGKPAPEEKKPAKDAESGEELPFYSIDKALAELRGAGTLQDVCGIWNAIQNDFSDSQREFPAEFFQALPIALAAVSIAELRAAKTVEDLQRTWKETAKAHSNYDLAMPIEVEAVHNECREVLEEQKGNAP